LHEVEAAEQVFLTSPAPLPPTAGAHWIVARGGVLAA